MDNNMPEQITISIRDFVVKELKYRFLQKGITLTNEELNDLSDNYFDNLEDFINFDYFIEITDKVEKERNNEKEN